MAGLTRTTLAIEKDLLRKFEAWMAAKGYDNRSEALRDLIRAALVESEWSNPKAKVVAVLSVIYDHEQRHLAQDLTHLQHEEHHAILCSQHVHLDNHQCLEVILMEGQAERLRRLADSIIAARGVQAGKLTVLSRNV